MRSLRAASSGRLAPLRALVFLPLVAWPSAGGAAPNTKKAPRGTIAVLNVGRSGSDIVARVARQLPHVGGWARHRGIAEHLAGQPHAAAMPTGRVGLELGQLVRSLREGRRFDPDDLFQLGRLLGVDYLLLLKVRKQGMSARLFSVHRRAFAPQGFERADQRIDRLQAYLKAQTRTAKKPSKRTRWWVWAAAAAMATVTIALAVTSGGDDRKGELSVRVSR